MKRPKKDSGATRKRSWSTADVDAATRQRKFEGARAAAAPPLADPEAVFTNCATNALLVSPYGVRAFVQKDGEELLCRVDAALIDGKTSVLASGDRVWVEQEEDEHVVKAVHTRRSKLSRPAVGRSREQVIAANVDLLVVVAATMRPPFKPGLVDRYLIAAEVGGVAPVLCLNKIDLVTAEPPQLEAYRQLGVTVIATSCKTGEGLEELRTVLREKLAVLTGHSGVGKSSLINALYPGIDIATAEVSKLTNKGRHTTTTARLHELPDGIRLIDTPGIKQLGLWGVSPEEVEFFFPEINAVAAECRFRDCTHVHEPDCAVKDAVLNGRITRLRYDSYLRIRESIP